MGGSKAPRFEVYGDASAWRWRMLDGDTSHVIANSDVGTPFPSSQAAVAGCEHIIDSVRGAEEGGIDIEIV